MPGPTICQIPIRATVRIINGIATVVAADYAEVDASRIAAILITGFGADAIPKAGDTP